MTTSQTTDSTQKWFDISDIGQTNTETPKADPATDPEAQKQMFLELLVAQIKNQNPLNPSDGAEFLAQLATFTQVEQSLGMRQELESIHDILADAQSEAAQNNSETEGA